MENECRSKINYKHSDLKMSRKGKKEEYKVPKEGNVMQKRKNTEKKETKRGKGCARREADVMQKERELHQSHLTNFLLSSHA